MADPTIEAEKSLDLEDILIKRYADIDVDTGGSAGWAGFRGRWDKNRDSTFSYHLNVARKCD